MIAEKGESELILKGPQGRINRAVWGPLNRTIISAGEDAVIRIWDSEVFCNMYTCRVLLTITDFIVIIVFEKLKMLEH